MVIEMREKKMFLISGLTLLKHFLRNITFMSFDRKIDSEF